MNTSKKISIPLLLIGSLAAFTASAQVTTTTGTNGVTTTVTNTATPPATFTIEGGLTQIYQALETSTNWAVWAGYGHSVQGVGRSVVFGDIGYNFNDYVGIVVGYDYLWGNGGHELNSVKGGMTLQLPMRPFAFIGSTVLTNLTCTPVVFDLVATADGGNDVGNIVGGGVDFDVYAFGNLQIHAGIDYENRSGEGIWNGDYVNFHAALSRNF